MNTAYNDALRHLRRNSEYLKKPFSERLFEHDWSYLDQQHAPIAIEEKIAVEEQENNSVTEKVKILDELHKFGKEKFEQSKSDRIHLGNGAVIEKKVHTNPLWEVSKLSTDEINNFYQSNASSLFNERQSRLNDHLDVVFITDEKFQTTPSNNIGDKFIAAFYEESVGVLFERMVNAMKLDPSRFTLLTWSDEVENSQDILFNDILNLRPKYIVTLGGYISSKFLQTKERLQSLRGKFYEVDIKLAESSHSSTFHLLPLFSPSYLHEAPNSKRLAWEDMQLLMQKFS